MLSIEKCRKVLEKNGLKYSDNQIKKIRLALYQIAEVEYEKYKSQQNSNTLRKSIN